MVGAACAERAQLARPLGAGKGQRVLVVSIVRDHSTIGGQRATQCRQNLRSHLLAIRSRRVLRAAEERTLLTLMFSDKLAHLVDGVDAVQIALALRRAPGKQPVAAKKNPVNSRIFPHRFLDHQRQFESRPLPGHPYDFAADTPG